MPAPFSIANSITSMGLWTSSTEPPRLRPPTIARPHLSDRPNRAEHRALARRHGAKTAVVDQCDHLVVLALCWSPTIM